MIEQYNKRMEKYSDDVLASIQQHYFSFDHFQSSSHFGKCARFRDIHAIQVKYLDSSKWITI